MTAIGLPLGLSWRRAWSASGYLLLARHLPWSPRPGGMAARRTRAWLGARMLDQCGRDVNIEHGAWFGSGRGVRLGDRSDIGMDAIVIGPVEIGRDVMMGPRCMLIASSHAAKVWEAAGGTWLDHKIDSGRTLLRTGLFPRFQVDALLENGAAIEAPV